MKAPQSVLQEWVCRLTFMQQSVLIASMRGPDGLPKDHVSKLLIRWLRRCVLYSAFESQGMGRPAVFFTPYEPGGGSFTGPSLPDRSSPRGWQTDMDSVLTQYLATLDAVPHHFQLHFMHAAEILGYKHPVQDIRSWWNTAYARLANDMHLRPEQEDDMDRRLGDNENDWRGAEEVVAKGSPEPTVCPSCKSEERSYRRSSLFGLFRCRDQWHGKLGPLEYVGTGVASSGPQAQNISKIDNRAKCPTCTSSARGKRGHGVPPAGRVDDFCTDQWHDVRGVKEPD